MQEIPESCDTRFSCYLFRSLAHLHFAFTRSISTWPKAVSQRAASMLAPKVAIAHAEERGHQSKGPDKDEFDQVGHRSSVTETCLA